MKKQLSLSEFASRWGIQESTVRNYLSDKEKSMPPVHKRPFGRSKLYFLEEDVINFENGMMEE